MLPEIISVNQNSNSSIPITERDEEYDRKREIEEEREKFVRITKERLEFEQLGNQRSFSL